MVSTAITFPQTRLINPRCGQKPGLAGNLLAGCLFLGFLSVQFFLSKSCILIITLRSFWDINPIIFHFPWRYTEFGGPVPHRPVEDLAFSVAKFIQKGGSFINYYMVSLFLSFTKLLHLWINQQSSLHLFSEIPVSRGNKFRPNCWWSFHCYKLWLWCPSRWIWYVKGINDSVLLFPKSFSIHHLHSILSSLHRKHKIYSLQLKEGNILWIKMWPKYNQTLLTISEWKGTATVPLRLEYNLLFIISITFFLPSMPWYVHGVDNVRYRT